MPYLVNTSEQRRYWPSLSADGHTLELDPGEGAEVDVPEGFDDPWLKRGVKPKARKQEHDAEPVSVTEKE